MADDDTPEDTVEAMNAALLAKDRASGRLLYIHGRPYADPGDETPPEPQESPFPWDLWDQ